MGKIFLDVGIIELLNIVIIYFFLEMIQDVLLNCLLIEDIIF